LKPTKNQSVVSGFLIFLLIIGAYAVGFIGWGSPKPSASSNPMLCQLTGCQTGTVSVAVTGSTVVFPTPYAVGVVACTVAVTTNCIRVIPWIQQLTSATISVTFRDSSYSIINFGSQGGGGLTVTAAAADTEIFGNPVNGGEYRFRMNTGFWVNGVRLILNYGNILNLGPAGTILKLKYSTDMVTWNDFSTIVQVAADAADGAFPITISTGNIVIPTLPGDVYLAPFISGGNGVTTVTIDSLQLEITGLSTTVASTPAAEAFTITRTQFTLRDVGAPASAYPILTGWLSYLTP